MSDSVGKPWLGGRPEDQAVRGGGGQPQQPAQNQEGQPQGGPRGGRGGRGR